jgi:predicted transcriptional regulator
LIDKLPVICKSVPVLRGGYVGGEMKRVEEIVLPDFGLFLKIARLQARIKTQDEACKLLAAENIQVSQSLLAKYEVGRVRDPDPKYIKSLIRM